MALLKRLDGDVQMIVKLRRVADRLPKLLGQDLVDELKQVELPEVIERTPLDTGALRASERVEGPFITSASVSASIVAGNADVDYAVYVHEDPEALHPIGEWKYVEGPMRESAPHMAGRIAARRALEKAVS